MLIYQSPKRPKDIGNRGLGGATTVAHFNKRKSYFPMPFLMTHLACTESMWLMPSLSLSASGFFYTWATLSCFSTQTLPQVKETLMEHFYQCWIYMSIPCQWPGGGEMAKAALGFKPLSVNIRRNSSGRSSVFQVAWSYKSYGLSGTIKESHVLPHVVRFITASHWGSGVSPSFILFSMFYF